MSAPRGARVMELEGYGLAGGMQGADLVRGAGRDDRRGHGVAASREAAVVKRGKVVARDGVCLMKAP